MTKIRAQSAARERRGTQLVSASFLGSVCWGGGGGGGSQTFSAPGPEHNRHKQAGITAVFLICALYSPC